MSGYVAGWGSPPEACIAPQGVAFKAVAAGDRFSLGVTSIGGFISGWGVNHDHVISGRPLDGDYVAVAAGWDHGLALHADGTLRAWTSAGWNASLGSYGTVMDDNYGQGAGTNRYTAIAAGEWFSMALRVDGTIWIWGDASYGTAPVANVPNNTPGMYKAIAAGGHHAVAHRTDGKIVAWGGTGYLSNNCNTGHPGVRPAVFDNEAFIGIGASHSGTFGVRASDRITVGWGCSCEMVGTFIGTPAGGGMPANGYFEFPSGKTTMVTGGYHNGINLSNTGVMRAWGQDPTPNGCNSYGQNVVPPVYEGLNVLLLGANNVGLHNIFIYEPPAN